MATDSQFRCAVAGPDVLTELRTAPLPLSLRASPAHRSFHRDIYLDTSDRSLALRGVACRLRLTADDRRLLTLTVSGADGPPMRYEAEVPELDARRALEGTSEPARRLRGLVDAALLRPGIELETERWTRVASSGWLRRRPRFVFLYDACTVRHGGLARSFEELQVRRLEPGGPHLRDLATALERRHGLRTEPMPKHQRAFFLAQAMGAEVAARRLGAERAVTVLAFDEGDRVGFLEESGVLELPVARGSGEEAARHLLSGVTGSRVGTIILLGVLPPSEDRDALEVWLARRLREPGEGAPRPLTWLPLVDALTRIGTPALRAPETVAALSVAARLDLATPLPPTPGAPDAMDLGIATPVVLTPRPAAPSSVRSGQAAAAAAFAESFAKFPPEWFLNVELSSLAFHQRVLELAEDEGLPLAERLRFLAIVSANLDEFFSVRVGALKAAILEGKSRRGPDGMSAREQVEAIAGRAAALTARQGRAAADCLGAAAGRGVRLRHWDELDDAARAALADRFLAELFPVLTPRAVTLSPGHPFPLIPHLTLAFAVIVRDVTTGPVHFASLALRGRLDRFMPVPGTGDLLTTEDVVRANIQAFYPARTVDGAWLFRVTRAAALDVNEVDAGDLLQAIEEELPRRSGNSPVRVEVERAMPPMVRDLLLRELRFERRGESAHLGAADVFPVDGLLDLTCLREVAARLPPAESFPPFTPKRPLAADRTLFAQIDDGDLLVYHPYDDFGATVSRFLEEAASDPEVVAIKLTLYRLGDRSPIVDALLAAAQRGKDVAVFVELKARFDEARNVGWVRRLEEAGVQVVYGLVGLKTHAKVALVVRRTAQGLRRYAHVGTGNYNPATARLYTDLGLLTADPEIAADLTDLFNQLTGSSGPPTGRFRRLLIAPVTLLPELLARIEREAALAREGRPARIRAQLNGLEDPEVIVALYHASQAGVEVDLTVRGLCALRPGVPELSERIRVRSILGRFLEHARVWHFGNGGVDEYLIGSADWRPRNLRRRVEVIAPVRAAALAARLDLLLAALLAEPSAWTLGPDGTYGRAARPTSERPHLHDRLLA